LRASTIVSRAFGPAFSVPHASLRISEPYRTAPEPAVVVLDALVAWMQRVGLMHRKVPCGRISVISIMC